MTQFLQDILRQPNELQRVIDFLCTGGQPVLTEAAAAVRTARHVYMTGIGASWHAALNAGALLHLWGRPVYTQDASELLHFGRIPEQSVIILISRSGRSLEIVDLLAKVRGSGATVIAITNSGDSPLARDAQIPIIVPVKLDHGISVSTYSTLAATAGALASAAVGSFGAEVAASLSGAVAQTAERLIDWQKQIAETHWLVPGSVYYFLARGTSLGSCYEARLLWEEAVKSPATAMGISAFRHGPQEIVVKDTCVGIWIDGLRMRDRDLAVVRDLKRLGASVMLIGHNVPDDAADLVFPLPEILPAWQFLIDIVPAQLAAERLARLSGFDCDSFRTCSYVVEDDYGLLHGKIERPEKR
jgi:glucosamine--fructose-6-phosphate aminotransferase (isomerizing)